MDNRRTSLRMDKRKNDDMMMGQIPFKNVMLVQMTPHFVFSGCTSSVHPHPTFNKDTQPEKAQDVVVD